MTREQTYQLPINVIIEIMKGLHEQVVLHACMPTLPGIVKQECVARVVVDENGLQACVITKQSTGGKLFEDEEAFHILQRYGTLGWTLQPLEPASALTRLPPDRMSGGQIPSRQVELTPMQMQALPPAQKKVFALVNGRNSLEYIAHLLTRSPEEVYYVLLELKQQHLIFL